MAPGGQTEPGGVLTASRRLAFCLWGSACSCHFIHNTCRAFFTEHDAFKVHPHCSMNQCMNSFVWLIFHCTDRLHFVYPHIH